MWESESKLTLPCRESGQSVSKDRERGGDQRKFCLVGGNLCFASESAFENRIIFAHQEATHSWTNICLKFLTCAKGHATATQSQNRNSCKLGPEPLQSTVLRMNTAVRN